MIRNYAIVRESATHAANAAKSTLPSLRDGRVEQEPAFTDRMLGRIETAMEGYEIKNVVWTAKTLTDRGPNAQEKEFGADFLGVLNIDLPDYTVSKGFLAQAKLIEPDDSVSRADHEKMVQQCKDMLAISPESFVFIYSITGITVVPAISVVGCSIRNPHSLYAKDIQTFFELHFECFIGDASLNAPDIGVLKTRRDEVRARSAFLLRLRIR